MKNLVLLIIGLLVLNGLWAQSKGYTKINNQYFEYMLDDCGDTIIVASLEGVSISSLRSFESDEDYRRYRRYRLYANKVYPYAVQAIRIFRETEYVMANESKKDSKKHIRRLKKELKEEFADTLKGLTKTQGLILMKMVERELDTPMYDLIKDLRGGVTASYWGTMGRLFGHRIKDGYIEGEDKILDAVLNDFNVSYELPHNYMEQKFKPEDPDS